MNNYQQHEQNSIWSDKAADDYVAEWGELPLHEKIPALCQIQPSNNVLDIGCGSGAAVRAIAKILTTGHVTGIDPTPRMISLSNELTPSSLLNRTASFLLASAEQIPLPNESCDLIIAVNTLHHWRDIHQSLAEIDRILAPEGRFICIDDIWEDMPCHPVVGEMPVTLTEGYNLKSTKDIMKLLTDKSFQKLSCEFHREPDLSASIIISHKLKEKG